MSKACWEGGHNSVQIDTYPVREAAVLIARVCEQSTIGPVLRGIIRGWKLDDEQTIACGVSALLHSMSREAESDCLRALTKLSVPERASALALYEGWWQPEDDRSTETPTTPEQAETLNEAAGLMIDAVKEPDE